MFITWGIRNPNLTTIVGSTFFAGKACIAIFIMAIRGTRLTAQGLRIQFLCFV